MKNDNSGMISDISTLLSREYGIHGKLSRLAGENENYRMSTEDGKRFVFKVAAENFTSYKTGADPVAGPPPVLYSVF